MSTEVSTQTRKTSDVMKALKDSEFSKKAHLVGELFTCKDVRDFVASMTLAHFDEERLRRSLVVLAGNAKNSKLFEADAKSLIRAVAEAAAYGWDIGGVLGHAYLVPYGGVVTMQPGYKGLLDLCYRSGNVVSVACECVHQGDAFEHVCGDDEKIVHKPTHDSQRHLRPITHVYASIKLKTGGIVRAVMTTEQIDAHKERYSKAWRSSDSAWQTAWPAMAKKTVLLQAIRGGKVPMSLESRQLVERVEHDSNIIDVVPTNIGTFEAEATEATPVKQEAAQ